ncbi:MAG: alpha-glycosidase [Acholeplasmataceae bacterium]|nr:alpha-glycosidase [Acholeplasmataceae bacterium]
MNLHALWHKAKSEFSYAFDEETLHILLRTAKNDVEQVKLVYGDPFAWDGDSKGRPFWKHEIKPMMKRYQTELFDYYFVEIKPPYLRTKYAFLLKENKMTYAFGSKRLREVKDDVSLYENFDLSEFFNYPYLNHEDMHQTPPWVKDTVWYQIFLDRFASDHNHSVLPWGNLPVKNHELYGGNLLGMMAKLDYLKDLGITGIYFTPIFEAPSAHKYDTTDYFKIDPQFGTNEDFALLVKKAHELGIKVMLDGVFNHAGYEHPFFQDVIKHGEKSEYKDCFFIENYPIVNFPLNSQGKPYNYHKTKLNLRTFAFTPYMPKWNTSHEIAAKHLLDCIVFWIKTYDIDGWRLDVSNEISHDFLRQIKKASRNAKKDTFILGENWDSSYPWLEGDQLDSVMNYDLSHPLWKYLEQKIDLKTFKDMVTHYLAYTPKNVMQNMFNLVGSHDTIRIKKRLKDDPRRVKLSYAFMMLSSGAPNIYYGDEVGMTGEHDPDNRRCMLWNKSEQDLDFLSFVKQLIALRNQHASFKTPDYHFINLPVLAFKKKSESDEILVFMNNGEKVSFDMPTDLQGNYLDIINQLKVEIGGKMVLERFQMILLKKEA